MQPDTVDTIVKAADAASQRDWTATGLCVLVILLLVGLVYKLLADAKADRDRFFAGLDKIAETLEKLGSKVDSQGEKISELTTTVEVWRGSQPGKRGGA